MLIRKTYLKNIFIDSIWSWSFIVVQGGSALVPHAVRRSFDLISTIERILFAGASTCYAIGYSSQKCCLFSNLCHIYEVITDLLSFLRSLVSN